jgi:hypothetical protein
MMFLGKYDSFPLWCCTQQRSRIPQMSNNEMELFGIEEWVSRFVEGVEDRYRGY